MQRTIREEIAHIEEGNWLKLAEQYFVSSFDPHPTRWAELDLHQSWEYLFNHEFEKDILAALKLTVSLEDHGIKHLRVIATNPVSIVFVDSEYVLEPVVVRNHD